MLLKHGEVLHHLLWLETLQVQQELNSSLFNGGNIQKVVNTSATEQYNGSGFSSGGTLGTAREGGLQDGTQTAALV